MALRARAGVAGRPEAVNTCAVNTCDEILVRLFDHTKTREARQLAAKLGSQDEANFAHVWCHGVGGYLWAVLKAMRSPRV